MSLSELRFAGNGPIINFGRNEAPASLAEGAKQVAPRKTAVPSAPCPAMGTYPTQAGQNLNYFA